MRIVAGKYRGKKLLSPLDINTRPTLDKTKESIFNIIGEKIVDSVCLDLFAGSGALGIEAISRGAKTVCLNDNHKEAIKIIKANIDSLKNLSSDVYISFKDYNVFLSDDSRKYDIVFLDPPYSMKIVNEIIACLVIKNKLNDNSIIVVETLKEDKINTKDFSKVKEYVYGKTKLTILWK